MKKLLLGILLFTISSAYAQIETTADTVFIGNTPVSVLKKIGTGFVAYSMDGNHRLINIRENYYRFENGSVAYPDVTVRSAEKTIEVFLENQLFNAGGLNEAGVKNFIAKYPTPLPVQQLHRDSREEINPEIR